MLCNYGKRTSNFLLFFFVVVFLGGGGCFYFRLSYCYTVKSFLSTPVCFEISMAIGLFLYYTSYGLRF